MGFLNIFSKSTSSALARLPTGSFSIDAQGKIVASTLPQTFPASQIREVSEAVLSTFREAQQANIPLTELVVDYSSLKLTAREMRGGAIIFLSPRALGEK